MQRFGFLVPVRTLVLAGVFAAALTAQAPPPTLLTTVLTPDQDATLYQDPNGALANGAGTRLIVGLDPNGVARRAVLRFDILSAIPPGSTVVGAQLELTEVDGRGAPRTVQLGALTEPWSEGPSVAIGDQFAGANSQAMDATWIHSDFPNTTWQQPGTGLRGTMELDVLSSGNITFPGTRQLPQHLQRVLDGFVPNEGFLITTNEFTSGQVSAYGSRESLTPPRLTIEYFEAEARVVDRGPGCFNGPGDSYTMTAQGLPLVPNPNFGFTLVGQQNPLLLEAVAFGASSQIPIGPLPGFRPNCALLLDPATIVNVIPTVGGVVALPIPNNPRLIGAQFFAQGVSIGSAGLIETSNELAVQVGL